MNSTAVNQVYRDKYPGNERRTIRIVEILPNGVLAVVVTDIKGKQPSNVRQTALKFSTLRTGYMLVEGDR